MDKLIDIKEIVDSQKMKLFNYNLVFWSFLICVTDGYNFTAPGYAAPGLVKAWHLTQMRSLAPIFSASLFGVLVGAPLLGVIADKLGRKKALILGAAIFALFTLVTIPATSITQIVVLRFLAGIGIGGVIPIIIALNSEFAPSRMRATLVAIMFSGFSVGAGMPGIVAAWLLPVHGWQSIFFVGGVIPFFVILGIALFVPESIKFLALRANRKAALEKLLFKLQPGLQLPPNYSLVISDEEQAEFSLKHLFLGRLAVLTSLIWLMYIMIGVVIYFVQIWSPVLLAHEGVNPAYAALSVTMFQIGGLFGVIAMGIFIDKWDAKPVLLAMTLAIPVLYVVGIPGLTEVELVTSLFLGGIFIVGSQVGLNILCAEIYPTSMRSSGLGWGLGVGRIGFILGAQIGSLQGMFAVRELFELAMIPAAICAAGCVWFVVYSGRHTPPRHKVREVPAS